MLASETQAIADLLRETMIEKYGADRLMEHFADTRDTLCYATNDNQQAVYGLMETASDLAVVIGGYNSSNTSHLVELLEAKFPTYFIAGPEKILHGNSIKHFDIHRKEELITGNFIPQKEKVAIAITSGASCPDSIVDNVLAKLLSLFENVKGLEEALAQDEKNAGEN
jgi:4-hydroxy-3-methylbut-2-enyl diphosphate reductase